MILEYVIDLNRPFTRRRFWRMAVVASRHNGDRDEYIGTVIADGQRGLKRKAEAAWRQAGANGRAVLTLFEEPFLVSEGWGTVQDESRRLMMLHRLRPVGEASVPGVRELRCLKPGCGHLLGRIDESGSAESHGAGSPLVSCRAPTRDLPSMAKFTETTFDDPSRAAIGDAIIEEARRAARCFEVHTACPRCDSRVVWTLPKATSWTLCQVIDKDVDGPPESGILADTIR